MEPVLNERSLEPADTPTFERMKALITVLRKLDALGFPRMLRSVRDALDREIEVGTTLRAWLFQKAPRWTPQGDGGVAWWEDGGGVCGRLETCCAQMASDGYPEEVERPSRPVLHREPASAEP